MMQDNLSKRTFSTIWTDVYNRISAFLFSATRLWLNVFIGKVLWTSAVYNKDTNYIKQRLQKKGTQVHYGTVKVNESCLHRLIVTPKKPKGLQLFFQGHAVSIYKTSTLKSVIQQAEMTDSIVIAYDQRGVGHSKGPTLTSSHDLQKDLDVQVAQTEDYLAELKSKKVLSHDTKWTLYGLCFGGFLAAMCGAKHYNNKDFSHAVISRSTQSLSHIFGWSKDFSFYFPSLFANPKDCRVSTKKKKYSLLTRVNMCLASVVLLSIQLIPRLIRFCMLNIFLTFIGWNMNIVSSRSMQNFYKSKKVKVLRVEGDEFVQPKACLTNAKVVKPVSLQLKYVEPSKKIYAEHYAQSELLRKKYSSSSDCYNDLIDEKKTTSHQAWSAWLWHDYTNEFDIVRAALPAA